MLTAFSKRLEFLDKVFLKMVNFYDSGPVYKDPSNVTVTTNVTAEKNLLLGQMLAE